jgi:hypothetical protein
MERLITVSANAIVAILTLTAIRLPPQPPRASRTNSEFGPTALEAAVAVPQRADAADIQSHGTRT